MHFLWLLQTRLFKWHQKKHKCNQLIQIYVLNVSNTYYVANNVCHKINENECIFEMISMMNNLIGYLVGACKEEHSIIWTFANIPRI